MIDLFLIVLLLWSLFSGWRNGFIKEVVSTVGFLVGLFVAATCYTTLGEYLAVNGSETNQVTSIIAFFILWIIVPIALGFAANVLTRAIKGMQLGIPNSLLGAVISFV
ncbi:MAG: CvpA family protein, partial [Bacteroidaceae bacterium]|nr:CvpA family protein [Bacteroidaceae bacterium]